MCDPSFFVLQQKRPTTFLGVSFDMGKLMGSNATKASHEDYQWRIILRHSNNKVKPPRTRRRRKALL